MPKKMTESELEEIKKWILDNKKEGTISASELNAKIKETRFDPQKILEKLKTEDFLFEVPKLNAWGVAKP